MIVVFSDDDCPRNNKRESSVSVSSRTSGQVTTKIYNDFGPSERYLTKHTKITL